MMSSKVFFLIFFVNSSFSSKDVFYLGPNFPNPQFRSADRSYIEIKITKNSNWTSEEVIGEVYEGDTVEVKCYGRPIDRKKPQFLYLEKNGGEERLDFMASRTTNRKITSYKVNALQWDSGKYICLFETNTKDIERSQQLTVVETFAPEPRVEYNQTRSLEYGKEEHIECEMIEGLPKADYEWTKNQKVIGNSRILTIANVTSTDEGEYLCTATNRVGKAYKYMNMAVDGVPGSSTVWEKLQKVNKMIVLAVIFAKVLIVIFSFLLLSKCCGRPIFKKKEFKPIDEAIPLLDYRPAHVIKPRCLTILEKLGDGEYGCVSSGKLRINGISGVEDIDVAIKTPKESGYAIRRMKEEYDIMKRILPHPNILTIIGGVGESERLPITAVVMELCEYKSVAEYLQTITANFKRCDKRGSVIFLVSSSKRNGERNGLARVPCVHRDLAARTVLLKRNEVCRIGNIGSRRSQENREYYNTIDESSIKWMAPESILARIYTQKSDVWSYAIFLYEVFSLGAIPFSNVANYAIPKHIKKGNKNPKPDRCPEKIYKLMKECWNVDPKKRPTFSECRKFFEEYLESNDPNTIAAIKNKLKMETERQNSMQLSIQINKKLQHFV